MKKIFFIAIVFIFSMVFLAGCSKYVNVRIYQDDETLIKTYKIKKGSKITKFDYKKYVLKGYEFDGIYNNIYKFNFDNPINYDMDLHYCYKQSDALSFNLGNRTCIINGLDVSKNPSDLRIFNYYKGRKIIGIEADCFKDNDKLENLYLPNNLPWIRSNSFSNLRNLKTVELFENTQLAKDVFKNCPNLKIRLHAKKIPDTWDKGFNPDNNEIEFLK